MKIPTFLGYPFQLFYTARITGQVKSETKRLAVVTSLVSIHHFRPRTGLVGPMSV